MECALHWCLQDVSSSAVNGTLQPTLTIRSNTLISSDGPTLNLTDLTSNTTYTLQVSATYDVSDVLLQGPLGELQVAPPEVNDGDEDDHYISSLNIGATSFTRSTSLGSGIPSIYSNGNFT